MLSASGGSDTGFGFALGTNGSGGAVNAAGMQKDLTFFQSQGWVTGSIKAADVVDMSFAERAAAALGPYPHKPH